MTSKKDSGKHSRKYRTFLTILVLFSVIELSGCAAGRLVGRAGSLFRVTRAASTTASTITAAKTAAPILNNMAKLRYVSMPSTRTRIAFSLPANSDEYANLYKSLPTQSQLSHIQQVQQNMALSGNTSKVGSWEDFVSFTESTDDPFIILIGHNDVGNFVFTNGELSTFDKLASQLNKQEKIGIFISCESKNYLGSQNKMVGIDYAIKYDEAHKAAYKISDYLDSNVGNIERLKTDMIIAKLRGIRFEEKVEIYKRRGKVIFATVGTLSYETDRKKRKLKVSSPII